MRIGRYLTSVALAGLMATPSLAAATTTPLSDHDLALLNRVTWGDSASSVAQMQAQGSRAWLDHQLHPGAHDAMPAEAQAQIDALPVSQAPMADLVVRMDAQQKALNKITDPDQKKQAQQAYQQDMTALAQQAATRSLLRDIYSPDQLQEQMTWFWFNHFNVHEYKRDVRAMVGDYEDQAIRPRALGRFRDLLEATLRHPAMLRYLDNDQNAAGHINENYAREIMELHTLGVGSGYTQKDVQELARILTGVGVDTNPTNPKLKPAYQPLLVRAGLFEFNPNRHDFGDKVFLGHTIKGSGFQEVEQALDIIAREPATAHHVSLQMATYFMGDNPSPALVDRMARTFQRSDGDIAETLKTMFTDKAFDGSLGHAFKDPVHYAVSAVRLAYDDRVIVNTQPVQGWINRMSEGLYNHETPDGYSMASAAWDGPGQLAVRFEIARQVGTGQAGLFRPADAPNPQPNGPPPVGLAAPRAELQPVIAPPLPRLQNVLYDKGFDRALATPTRTALGQAATPQDWNTLFLASPEFMRR